MKLNISISLWNYIHHFPLRKGGTSFSFDGGIESLGKVVGDVAAAGFGVEVWPSWRSWEWTTEERGAMVAYDFDLYSEEHRDSLAEILRGVRSSWHAGGATAVDGYRQMIDTVAHAGSEILVVHASNLFLDGPEPDFDFAGQVLEHARSNGVKIALENASEGEQEEDPALWNLALMKRAIERFEDIGICLDTTHVQKFKRNSLKEYVDALRDRICHLHISDAQGDHVGIGRLHTVPGTGTIPGEDWRYLLQALDENGFNGSAVLEIIPLPPIRVAQQTEAFLGQHLP